MATASKLFRIVDIQRRDLELEEMVLTRLLLAYVLFLALLLWEPREVCSGSSNDDDPNKLESIVHDELPFAQGLGLSSIASFHGDIAGGTQPHTVTVAVAATAMSQPEDLGIVASRLDADNHEHDENLKIMREQRGYLHMDIVELTPEKMPNYEAMIKRFFEEHLHIDEEARYCLEGSGYFDVRDEDDRWVRVSVRKGGLIVVPAGIYHRFTLDKNNYIKAMRLFSGSPDWTAYNRPHDHLPARKKYLAALHNRREAQQDD